MELYGVLCASSYCPSSCFLSNQLYASSFRPSSYTSLLVIIWIGIIWQGTKQSVKVPAPLLSKVLNFNDFNLFSRTFVTCWIDKTYCNFSNFVKWTIWGANFQNATFFYAVMILFEPKLFIDVPCEVAWTLSTKSFLDIRCTRDFCFENLIFKILILQ